MNRTLPASVVVIVAAMTLLLGAPSALAAGPATHLQFSQQPTDEVAGDPVAPAVVVMVLDADESPVAGVDVTVALSGGDGAAVLGGTPTETSAADGKATFSDLTVDKAGIDYLLTASATGVSDLPSDPFAVDAGPLASIVIAPSSATVVAGGSQAYTAEGFDGVGNDLGDVTSATTFTIDPGSGATTCPGATCSPTAVGDWTVTGDDGGVSDTATLHVDAGPLASIVIAPSSATVVAGGSQAYTAEGFDGVGNDLGDVTSATTFTIDPGSGATTCPGATCSPTAVGDWTVTGDDGGVVGIATLHVIEGDVVTIQIFPIGGGTLTAGGSKSFRSEGYNAAGHDIGDVTADTHFGVESGAGGSCSGVVCTATIVGDWVVTGTFTGGAPTDAVTLHVLPGAAARLGFDQQPVNTPAGVELPTVTVDVQDAFGNLVTAVPSGKVVLTLKHHPSGSHLAGGGAVRIVAGVATFRHLVIDKPGTGYTLLASGTKGLAGFQRDVSDAFNIKGYTRVTLSAAHGLIAYGGQVSLTAHLAACLDDCTLKIFKTSDLTTPIASGHVNSAHNLIRLVTGLDQNTTFVAAFDGDSRYRRAESDPVRVNVHVLTGSGLQGYTGTKDGYRIFRYHPACPQKHTGCPQVDGWVTPDKHGDQLHFVLQAHVGGRWQTISTTKNGMHTDGSNPRSIASIIWIYGGASVRNIPLRTRATYDGDSVNAGSNSVWRYFKVV